VRRDDPAFEPNHDFARDMFNIVVGICWQTSLVSLPVCIVIRRFDSALIAASVIALTSLILKFTWYDHLEKREMAPRHAAASEDAEAQTKELVRAAASRA